MIEHLESRRFLSASVANGVLTVTGSDHGDRIQVVQRGAALIVHEGKAVARFGKRDHIQQIIVNALGGNDRVTIVSKIGATVDGGDGKDLIVGGAGSDVLVGGNGNDRILGQAGNDSIGGGAGRDVLFGGAGDDTIDAYDTEADQLTGGAGNDSARVDSEADKAWNIENYLTDASDGSIAGSTYIYTGNIISDSVNLGPGGLNLNGGSISGGLVSFIPGGTFGSGTLTLNSPGSSGVDRIPVTDGSAATINVNSGLLNIDSATAGTLTISDAVLGGTTERGGFIDIDSDGVIIGFVEGGGGASMIFNWTPTGGGKMVVPNNPLPPVPQEPATDPAVESV